MELLPRRVIHQSVDIAVNNEYGGENLINASRIDYYCYHGNIDGVIREISDGEKPFTFNYMGVGAIHYACFSGNLDLVKFLVEIGVPLSNTKNGMSPLNFARNKQVANYLIEMGIKKNALNSSSRRFLKSITPV